MSMWHVDYIPADFTAVVIGLSQDISCHEAQREIEHGRKILSQLRRRKVRLPSEPVMARWNRSLKSFKKHCRRR
jgi:hypothetical protein